MLTIKLKAHRYRNIFSDGAKYFQIVWVPTVVGISSTDVNHLSRIYIRASVNSIFPPNIKIK